MEKDRSLMVAGSVEKEPQTNIGVEEEAAGDSTVNSNMEQSLGLVVGACSVEQEPKNNIGSVDEAARGSTEESVNPNVDESLPLVLQVQSLNVFVDVDLIIDQIREALKDQMANYKNLLRGFQVTDDLQDSQTMVVYRPQDDVNKSERKRGRKPSNELIGPISFRFELPKEFYKNHIEVDKVLATHVTKFTLSERLQYWTMEVRKRINGTRDVYYTHLPSKQKLRSKQEVINFVLCEATPPTPSNKTSKKRKLAIVAIDNDDLGSTSSASSEKIEISSDPPQEIEMGNEMVNDSMVDKNEKISSDSLQEEEKGNETVSTDSVVEKSKKISSNPPQEIVLGNEGPTTEESEKSKEPRLKNKLVERSFDQHQEMEIMSTEEMIEEFIKSGHL